MTGKVFSGQFRFVGGWSEVQLAHSLEETNW